MNNQVLLHFKKDQVCLAGYAFGKNIYETQVKGIIDIKSKFYIIIPDTIEMVFSSFVNGFFENIINEIGFDDAIRFTNIVTDNEEIRNSFLKELR